MLAMSFGSVPYGFASECGQRRIENTKKRVGSKTYPVFDLDL